MLTTCFACAQRDAERHIGRAAHDRVVPHQGEADSDASPLHDRGVRVVVSLPGVVSWSTTCKIGSKPFPGTGLARTIYFSILIPHVILAAVVPLTITSRSAEGLRRDDARHRTPPAKVTLPLWIFVSVTGVDRVCVMLYQDEVVVRGSSGGGGKGKKKKKRSKKQKKKKKKKNPPTGATQWDKIFRGAHLTPSRFCCGP